MREVGNAYLTELRRPCISAVALLLTLTLIPTPQLSAQNKCPCAYPFFTRLLDEGKCTPLVCTETDIAIECKVAESNPIKTSNFLYLIQKTSGVAFCRTLTDPGQSSSPSATIEDFSPAGAEVEDCLAALHTGCL